MPDNEQLLRGIAHIDEFTKQEADKAKAYIVTGKRAKGLTLGQVDYDGP